MKIRNWREDDLPVLREILVDSFGGVSIDEGIEERFGEINGRDWRWRKARHLDDDLRRPEAAIFVMEEGERIVGFISTWIDREAGIGQIPNLSIREEYRGRGGGRRLIEYALDHFRDRGVTHAKIETLAQNDIGRHLYPSVGFREVARQIHFVAELTGAGAGGDEDSSTSPKRRG